MEKVWDMNVAISLCIKPSCISSDVIVQLVALEPDILIITHCSWKKIRILYEIG